MYLHVVEDAIRSDGPTVHQHIRAAFDQVLIRNEGSDALPPRTKLNVPDPDTFYTPGSEGYTDYPFLRVFG